QADEVYGEKDSFAFEVSGTAALYRGNWKITKTPEPFGDGEWHLYDITTDPGETTDVAAQHPVVFQEMLNEYQSYANDVGVFEMAAGDSARKQLTINGIKKFSANYWYVLLAFLAALAATLYGMFRMFKLAVGRRPARQERT
ncbi:MAG: arylsulfatase, partial [Acidimicrobiia bacterium]